MRINSTGREKSKIWVGGGEVTKVVGRNVLSVGRKEGEWMLGSCLYAVLR